MLLRFFMNGGVRQMAAIRFALIGSGWRSEFYIRIASLCPELFSLTSVLVRSEERAGEISDRFGVPAVTSLEELLLSDPEFVVISVKKGMAVPYILELSKKDVPVLTETPPSDNMEDLTTLWEKTKHERIQVAEQYLFQPFYAAWKKAVEAGMLGEIQNISVSCVHGYHAASVIRAFLGIGAEEARIFGKRYYLEVAETGKRGGMARSG